MKPAMKAKLEAAGWKVGTVAEFLELSSEEAAFVELKLALSGSLRQWRTRRKLTQEELARLLRSSQSRVAKMEAADATVSIDLLVRSLFALGAQPRDLAQAISGRRVAKAG